VVGSVVAAVVAVAAADGDQLTMDNDNGQWTIENGELRLFGRWKECLIGGKNFILFEMKKFIVFFALCVFLCAGYSVFGQQEIALPAPGMTGGKPLMEALKDRKTGRSFSAKPLEMQMISDLLWAANGINRPESGKRTAPSAVNYQETDLYVCLPAGIYLYDAEKNVLKLMVSGDLRAKMGKQDFVAEAPLVLVYVADFARMGKSSDKDKEIYAGIDVGFISQNVYLYCASAELSTVVLGYIDKDEMAKVLKLSETQKVILSQPVGWPGDN